MWQVLLAAAVAGSGFYAKRLLNINGGEPISAASVQSSVKCDEPEPEPKPEEEHHSSDCYDEYENTTEIESSRFNDESVFRFSSASGSSGRTRRQFGSSNLRKKSGYYGSRGNGEKKRGSVNSCGAKLGEDHDQRRSGKRFAVCLKKRRTSRNSSAQWESCASKDNPSFGWGLGVGIMYMMSAGKAEIGRLNTVMDETVKVVQELKTEIAKRKSYRTHTNSTQVVVPKSNNENCDEVECPSSVITEELQLVEPEMDQLEAELESEFQKLPLNLKTEEVHDEYVGVKPTELDQKLCHLLIEQQEGQIVELETELQRTNSKLNEKEAQLQALKDCVRRLTHVSLATASDEETECHLEEKICDGDGEFGKIGTESKKSMVGIKRAIDFECYG